MGKEKSFNDKLVRQTVLPAIYLWLLASGAVVYTGIMKPDVVLQNLDGFIALIAIIGGIAAPAFNTLLRTWEAEQANEIVEVPAEYEHRRGLEDAQHKHQMHMEKENNTHSNTMETIKSE
tara:strand:- start:702 stop:1061 length:360 start_codon:yes stop_codon:yes gene_type:complete